VFGFRYHRPVDRNGYDVRCGIQIGGIEGFSKKTDHVVKVMEGGPVRNVINGNDVKQYRDGLRPAVDFQK
jgi:hypothetical protein